MSDLHWYPIEPFSFNQRSFSCGKLSSFLLLYTRKQCVFHDVKYFSNYKNLKNSNKKYLLNIELETDPIGMKYVST